MGKQVAPKALRETLLWLANPAGWEKGGENPAVNDKVLAAIQFAAALNELQEPDTAAGRKAAEIVAGSQKPDGSWVIDEGSIGSPATYGTALGTYMALRALERGNTGAFTERIRKARDWLQHRNASSVLDASAPMLAGVADYRKLIIAWQNKDGGGDPGPSRLRSRLILQWRCSHCRRSVTGPAHYWEAEISLPSLSSRRVAGMKQHVRQEVKATLSTSQLPPGRP